MVSKEQDFKSEWRVVTCQGSAEQVNHVKQRIDKLLRKAGRKAGDSAAMGLECHIVGSVPIQKGSA